MFGWAQLFIIRTSSLAGLSIIAADYIGFFVEMTRWQHTVTALSVIVVLGALNYVGIERASFFQKVSTVAKVAGIAILVMLALFLTGGGQGQLSTTAAPTASQGVVGNTVAAIMLVLFSYLGWDRVGYVAGEMKNPRTTLPRSLFWGLGVVVLSYLLINWAYHWTLGMEGMRESTIVASDMATLLIGPEGAALIALLVIICVTGSLNGSMMAAPRVYYAMAKDGLFFRWMDYVHPVYRTPSRAIIVFCLWGMVILLVRGTFATIVSGMVFVILFFYGLTTVALFVMRRREQSVENVYRIPGYPWLPGFYLAIITVLIVLRVFFEWEKSLVDLVFVATGLPFAFYWLRRRNSMDKQGEER